MTEMFKEQFISNYVLIKKIKVLTKIVYFVQS